MSRTPSAVRLVGVVGGGTMGRGIAQLCAQKGFGVLLYDSDPAAAAAARRAILESLEGLAAKGKLTREQSGAALRAIRPATSLHEVGRSDLVVEAVSEDLAVKRAVFQELDLASKDAILASNTSSFCVGSIVDGLSRPGRALGMHFFNPPALMRLVEIARAPATDDAAFKKAWTFALELGKMPVEVRDSPGFIVNRVVRPFYLQAQGVAAEGGAGFEAIDREIRERGSLPMGPFELMDLIGLDVNLAISRAIYEALGRPERLRPHFIQERLVEAGRCGRKTGKGFYVYERGRRTGVNPEAARMIPPGQGQARPGEAWLRVRDAIIDEAQRAVADGVSSEKDVDTAVRLAMNFPQGPFEWRASREKA